MNNQVLIASNSKTGKVVTASEFVDKKTGEVKTNYKIMVKQSSFVAKNGYINESVRTAFITLDERSYNSLNNAGLLVDGAPLPIAGKLVVTETLTPYTIKTGERKGQKQTPKRAGKDGAVMTHQGQPIYRNTEFTQDMSRQDVLLTADKAGSSVVESFDDAEE